jgi:hypothetical protein
MLLVFFLIVEALEWFGFQLAAMLTLLGLVLVSGRSLAVSTYYYWYYRAVPQESDEGYIDHQGLYRPWRHP